VSDLRGVQLVPRFPGTRETGDFFLVRVLAKTGTETWSVQFQNRIFEIRTSESLVPGALVRVHDLPALPPAPGLPITFTGQADASLHGSSALLLMFQGLPLIPQRLRAMELWAKENHAKLAATEADAWCLIREARDPPLTPAEEETLQAWLNWEKSLFSGKPASSPDGELFELWSAFKAAGRGQWIVCPFEWEVGHQRHPALIKAWIPHGGAVECWSVAACPGVPVRVHCGRKAQGWQMTLQIFDEGTRCEVEKSWPRLVEAAILADPSLELALLGPNASSPSFFELSRVSRVNQAV